MLTGCHRSNVMIANLSSYLVALDGAFEAAFTHMVAAEQRIRPVKAVSVVEPSRTQVAVAQQEGAKHVALLSSLPPGEVGGYLARNPDAISMLKAAVYDHAHTYHQLVQFIWARKSAVADGIAATRLCIENGLFLATLAQLRATMEQVGALLFVDAKTAGLVDDRGSLQEQSTALTAFSGVLFKNFIGTRIDWEHYLSNPIEGGKSKEYTPHGEFQSAMSRNVMDAVDAIEKRIKGARRAYEFLCEFSHPNIGTYFAYRSGKSIVQRNDSVFTFVETTLGTGTPSVTIAGLKEPLGGTFSLFCKELEVFEDAGKNLEAVAAWIGEANKKKAQAGIKNWGPIWNAGEPCPCLSGVQVGRCCGKGIVR